MADYNAIYEKQLQEELNGINSDVEKYQQAQQAQLGALEQDRAAQLSKIMQERDKAMQQSYVSRRMAEKNMPQLLAAQGITGGMSETTASQIYNDYLRANNSARTDYSNASTSLETGFAKNKANLTSQYNQYLAQLRQRAKENAMAVAQARYQAQMEAERIAREEEERKRQEEERKRQEEERLRQEEAERQRQAEYAAAAARSSYSGNSGSSSQTKPKKRAPYVIETNYYKVGRTGVKKVIQYSDGTQKVSYNYGQGGYSSR